jgi:pimeloyl-ACP methyl ester carboxylesterase
MGADSSIFKPQLAAFENIVVPSWTPPKAGDSLQSYSLRMAESINVKESCFVGGASFGGIVALEMARHLNAKGCILIGSVRSPSQLPKRIRFLKAFAPMLAAIPLKCLQQSAAASIEVLERTGQQHTANVGRQFSQSDTEIIRWSAKEILRWKAFDAKVPVRHIHGNKDRVFPIRDVTPDEVVDGGGHVISLTHGEQVNEFIFRETNELAASI